MKWTVFNKKSRFDNYIKHEMIVDEKKLTTESCLKNGCFQGRKTWLTSQIHELYYSEQSNYHCMLENNPIHWFKNLKKKINHIMLETGPSQTKNEHYLKNPWVTRFNSIAIINQTFVALLMT